MPFTVNDETDTNMLCLDFLKQYTKIEFEIADEYSIVLARTVLAYTDIPIYYIDEKFDWFITTSYNAHKVATFPDSKEKDVLRVTQNTFDMGYSTRDWSVVCSIATFQNVFFWQFFTAGKKGPFKYVEIILTKVAEIGGILSIISMFTRACAQQGLSVFLQSGCTRYPESLLYKYFRIVPDSISYIGEYAFYNCSSLTSVTIPNNVEYIEQYAFYGCSKLSSITIPNSVNYIYNYVFNGCTSLKELIIEDGDSGFSVFGYHTYSSNATGKGLFYDCPLETVYIGRNCYESNSNTGYSPFYCNDTLSTLQIGKSVTQIGPYMFYGCTSLTNVSIPISVTCILDYAFANCTGLTSILIPDSITRIKSNVFYGCSSLTNITIPNSVTEIGQSAFANCTGLTSILIPDSITRIESNIFYGCSGLTNITIPNSVTEIGKSAFENCAGLTSILIPDSVSKIGASSFKNCARLEDIILSDGVESIGSNAFEDCIRIKSITIPSSVTSISHNAFRGAYQITELIIADSETPLSLGCTVYDNNVGSQRYGLFFDCTLQTVYIGRNLDATYPAFYDETSLFSVEISNSVTMITSSTFSGCRSLTSVIIPTTVTYIMNYVFKYCTDLTTINYRGSEEQWNAITIGSDNTPLTTATIVYNYTDD